ncbi:putative metalloenzyme, LuxS/M16 peptidase [Helianthus annuus]|nr:putative metalloenzyme, LuxS/M16 peptidase [Helianthus annuus]
MLCTIAVSGSISHFMNINCQSQYADRLPIGLEKVIRTVSPEIVNRLYTKWYNLQNMAVIVVVGDFSDTKSVVDLIKTHFGSKVFATDYVDIPRFLVPSHEEPRISCFMESEAAGKL